MTSNLFNEFIDAGPEAKLELIESKLIVGNTLVGSRLLLKQILTGWGARAAIALAPIEQWLEALRLTYNAPIPPELDSIETIATPLQTWAASYPYQPEDLLPGSRGEENHHNPIRSYISHAFWEIAKTLGGQSLSRDFVMRLGNNGFTPDILLFLGLPRNTLREYYLEGPAEMVLEVLRPGHEYADRIIKRDYYAAGGVPEYVIVNPVGR
ncbi:Uma2 family endonuclease [Planktothrix mougeotii]|uniref:Uma2 family endonuclease n=1 Tax=Planktothrix mougeotii LEGE 06226 TaxID=1828728 RepID=A0ABR9UM24_9CYAN|nr:Uma2 family endonuclease [Planktothrix mougeotii]MBE9146594.1 Uma2 family endonuclease [Planktothrix mougeotii LEGE 06226]